MPRIRTEVELTGIEKIEKIYEAATGEWTGCDWCQPYYVHVGNYETYVDADAILDGQTPEEVVEQQLAGKNNQNFTACATAEEISDLREQLLSAAQEAIAYCAHCSDDAQAAESEAGLAIQAVRAGDLDTALECARLASNYESEYGDNPTWGPLYQEIKSACEDQA